MQCVSLNIYISEYTFTLIFEPIFVYTDTLGLVVKVACY